MAVSINTNTVLQQADRNLSFKIGKPAPPKVTGGETTGDGREPLTVESVSVPTRAGASGNTRRGDTTVQDIKSTKEFESARGALAAGENSGKSGGTSKSLASNGPGQLLDLLS
jgi:hypothetical protein